MSIRILLFFCAVIAGAGARLLLRGKANAPEAMIQALTDADRRGSSGSRSDASKSSQITELFISLARMRMTADDLSRVVDAGIEAFRLDPVAAMASLEALDPDERLMALSLMLQTEDDDGVRIALLALQKGWVTPDSHPAAASKILQFAALENPDGYASWLEKFAAANPPERVLDMVEIPTHGYPAASAKCLQVMLELAAKSRAGFTGALSGKITVLAMNLNAETLRSNPQLVTLLAGQDSLPEWFHRTWASQISAEVAAGLLTGIENTAAGAALAARISDPDAIGEATRKNLPPEVLKEISNRKVLTDLAQNLSMTSNGADLLGSLPNSVDQAMLSNLASTIALQSSDPAATLQAIPESNAALRSELIAGVVKFWAERSTVGASRFVAEHPGLGDTAILALLPEIADDPESSAAWIAKISDPAVRASYADKLKNDPQTP